MFNPDNFIIRDDFYDKYCNLGGISLYIAVFVIIVYIVWNYKTWI